MANHSWYLYETLMLLSLVDPKASDDEKRDIADRILDLRDDSSVGYLEHYRYYQ